MKRLIFLYCLFGLALVGDDALILEDIGERLSSTAYKEVTVTIDNGVAILDGSVDTVQDSKNAESAVLSVQGVLTVRNHLSVKTIDLGRFDADDRFAGESDRLLLVRIRRELNSFFNHKYDNVSIDVSNGVVTLQGSVKSEQDRLDAVWKISWIPGVIGINNYLQVE